jgi:hypothetical protein
VADYGTGTLLSHNEDFPGSMDSAESPRVAPQFPPLLSLTSEWIFLPRHASDRERAMSNGRAHLILLRPPFADNENKMVQEC